MASALKDVFRGIMAKLTLAQRGSRHVQILNSAYQPEGLIQPRFTDTYPQFRGKRIASPIAQCGMLSFGARCFFLAGGGNQPGHAFSAHYRRSLK